MAKRRRDVNKTIAEPTGKDLVDIFLHSRELIEGTERGNKDIEAGRFVTLAELKRRLGDV